MINLRPYQTGAIKAFRKAAKTPGCSQMIVLPTGTGKTVTGLALAKEMNARTLWIAHRDELITQPMKALGYVWPGTRGGIVKANINEWMRPVVFASIQTICRPKRLAEICKPDWDLVVIDEAHHSTAQSYRDVIKALGCGTPEGPPLLGLTATPGRADNAGLDAVFDGICYQLHLAQAIKAGYLVGVDIQQRPIDVDLDKVGKSGGDFKAGELDDALLSAGIVDEVVAAYLEHATTRKTIIFTISVKQAERIAECLNELGHAAGSVSGYLDTTERRKRLKAFADNDVKVIVNCMVLTEGYDQPDVDCIIMARPTQSKSLYVQCIGRGLRLSPGKSDCRIIDMVGLSRRHTLVQAPVIFGLESQEQADKERKKGSGMTDDELREFWRKRLSAQACGLAPITKSALRWIRGEGGAYLLSVGQYGTVRMTGDEESDWMVEVIGNRVAKEDRIALTQQRVDLEFAQGLAEDYVRRCGQVRISEGKYGTEEPATAGQKHALDKWRVKYPAGLTKGEASDMLTAAAAKAHAPATPKQLAYLRRLGHDVGEGLSKREAGRMIGVGREWR